MPDPNLLNQAAYTVPAGAVGGAGGVFVAIVAGLKIFARTQDVDDKVTSAKAENKKDIDLAKAEIRAEMAERYAHKDELAKIDEKLNYITTRIDQIADRKS